jgi:eukaryotic-like serine/threonine-protein kinase
MGDPLSPDSARVTLGRFELVYRLDVGGMAEIFLALERGAHAFERLVVIKRALPHLASKRSFHEMFLQEARFVARLNHPNIVQIHELGEADGAPFIAMEHVLGASFRDLVRTLVETQKPIPLGVVVGLVAQACAGAHAAHELTDPEGKPLGLVHRDISPHNLMVTRAGHVKLLDFGIAKATELGIDTTRTGALKGKVHYMSPEQVLQTKLDRRSDVFALGIVAWELLTSKRLFKRDNELATMQAITSGEAWPPSDFREGVPAELSQVVMKALRVDPAQRQPTAEVLRRELEAAADAAGLRHDADAVGAFITEVMGRSLEAHEVTLRSAVERAKQHGFQPPADVPERAHERVISRSETMPRASLTSRASRRLGLPPSQLRVAGLVAVAALFLGAAVGYAVMRKALSGPLLRVAWPQILDSTVMAQDLEPLRQHLETQMGRPVEFAYAGNYHDLAGQLLDGGVSFASLPPALFIRTQLKDPRITTLAVKVVGGSSGTDGVLLGAEGSTISSVAELEGKTLCVPDLESTTGALFPRLAMQKAGLDWEKDVTVVLSGNHLQVLRDLLAHKCEAGATYSGAFASAVTQGVDVSSLRQVAVTGRSPQDAVVAGAGVPKTEFEALQRALLSYKPPAANGVTMERITGFTAARPEDFAALRELLTTETPR